MGDSAERSGRISRLIECVEFAWLELWLAENHGFDTLTALCFGYALPRSTAATAAPSTSRSYQP
jgi:hypothetical protein